MHAPRFAPPQLGPRRCVILNKAANEDNVRNRTTEQEPEVNMKSTEQKGRLDAAGDTKRAVKRPYVKPEVRHEQVFETQALSCGKVQTTQQSCHFTRKNS